DPLYQTTKPYILDYASQSLPTTNQIMVDEQDIPLYDIRGREHLLTFKRSGIAVIDMQSAMSSEDFSQHDKIVDYTSQDSLVDFIKDLSKDSAEEILNRKYICVNVWKPLQGPVYDWPLALCDASTVNPDKDLVINDNVVSQINKNIENVMVHYNSNQIWYYLSNQMPSELLIFRQHNSEGDPGLRSFQAPFHQDPDS
ncbi:MAG: hypothetical protein Q9173_004728, partial [Seirophora scorigena]